MEVGTTMQAKFSARDIHGRKYSAGTTIRYTARGWEIAPAASATPSIPTATRGFRTCRCCGRHALHTTAPHLGCDDCV